MSTWNLEMDFCRCCHSKASKGSFRNLLEPYYILGEEEIYADMLKNCFDLELEPICYMLNTMTYMICGPCVCRLREVNKFRQQVFSCEMRFRAMIDPIVKAVSPNKVQVELKQDKLPENSGKIKPEELDQTSLTTKAEPKEAERMLDDDISIVESETRVSDIQPKKLKFVAKPKAKSKPNSKSSPKLKAKEEQATRPLKRVVITAKTDGDGNKKYVAAMKSLNLIHCKVCDLLFATQQDLGSHYVRSHKKCPECGEAYKNLKDFRKHRFKVHGIGFECGSCDYKNMSKYRLDHHIRRVHLQERNVTCPQCDMKFVDRIALKNHSVKHTDKMYSCSFCSKTFLRRWSLKVHEMIHTDTKNQVCKVCEARFVQKSSLVYHMNRYHHHVPF